MSMTLFHSDTVSGTTIFDDGTKAYWTEGRSSEIEIAYPDGRRETVSATTPHPITLSSEMTDGTENGRPMTEAEELEWAAARGH